MFCMAYSGFMPDFSLEMGSARFIFFGNTAKFHYCLCRRSGGGMEIEMNEKTLYIKNARIVRGDGRVPEAGGVIVSYADGKGTISEIGKVKAPENCSISDAKGAYLFPAFVDIGCRFFDSKHPSRDSIASAGAAAVGGGFLTLLCEPDEAGMALKKGLTVESRCRIIPAVYPRTPAEIAQCGRNVYSDNGHWISDPGLMREIMLACAASDSLFISTCIDQRIAGDGVINPGKTARILGLPIIPESAETTAAARDILLAAETGCRLHIRAVSCENTLALIRYAKQRGFKITCGTSALYYSMSDSDMFYYGGSAKVMPPLRNTKDVKAIREALADGTVDCITSLHTPLTRTENCSDLRKCYFGASGFDTAFSAFITYMVKSGFGNLDLLARLFSLNPAKILGLDSSLKAGARADFALADPDAEIVVSSNTMKSKSVNTPYLGLTLNGCIKAVFSDGVRI